MTLAAETNRNDYVGNGSTNTYSYSFRIFEDSDLTVTVRDTNNAETTLTLTTDYTVTGAGSASGTIVLVSSGQAWLTGGNLTTNYSLTIRRIRPLTQTTDIRNLGDFYPEVHEDAFDHQTMLNQQQQDEIDRAFKLPETISADDFDATLPATVLDNPGLAIGVNEDGDGLALIAAAGDLPLPVSIANGGTNSSTALANGKLMKSLAGAIVEAAIGVSGSKLTGLSAGTAAGDSIRYEQLSPNFLSAGGGGAQLTTSSATYVACSNCALTITPKSATSLIVYVFVSCASVNGNIGHVTVFKDGTNTQGSTNSMVQVASTATVPLVIVYAEVAGSTSARTYDIRGLISNVASTLTIGVSGSVVNAYAFEVGI